ncbi:MAG: hypothetical protein HC910_04970 [Spirulinaceae cyanobacterium SM2_1_0]|nr:hypothetical protein [Spirulinaceae cyanobacterium SM2_1_0]
MQDKQKVTLYLPPATHRQLKIAAAVNVESMSELVERAVSFYLQNPDIVEEADAARHGRSHRVYSCPECESQLVQREDELVAVQEQPSVLPDAVAGEISEKVRAVMARSDSHGEESLVPC